MIRNRASGILLHISSLPSKYGIGDLGPKAYKFIDFLVRAKQSIWQILPLNPTTLEQGNSPYVATSAFAGNPQFISPSLLLDFNLLTPGDVKELPNTQSEAIDYLHITLQKQCLLNIAYERFKSRHSKEEYNIFCEQESNWLENHAVYIVLRQQFPDCTLSDLPNGYRDMDMSAIKEFKRDFHDSIKREKFFQFLFFKQWHLLKQYANRCGIRILGDIPFYVGYDSADVWANPSLFKLTKSKKPLAVAGVPPDSFSDNGQLWGNPVYNWEALKNTDYSWWIERIKHNLSLFDIVRIDHFRGFSSFWEVLADQNTAKNGKWRPGPKDLFFKTLFRHIPFAPIIAEDLGTITPEVRELMHKFQIPGTKVLLFSFDGDSALNPYLPHNHIQNAVLYTGTHDNNTIKGWFESEASPQQIQRLLDYIGHTVSSSNVHWELIRLAMMSVCNLVIFPMQDILGLGEKSRMNRPSITSGNWEWQLHPDQVDRNLADKLAELTEIYGRD